MASLPAGCRGCVAAMAVEDDLRYQLNSMGFLPGAEVRVIRRAPFRGAILVGVGRSQYAIGREIASRIRISPG